MVRKLDLILTGIVLVLATISLWMAGVLVNPFGEETLQLHDSFFDIPAYLLQLLFFSLIAYPVFGIRQLLSGFRHIYGNVALILSAFILLMLISEFERTFYVYLLTNTAFTTVIENTSTEWRWTSMDTMRTVQALLLLTVIITSYKTGKNKTYRNTFSSEKNAVIKY